MSVDGTYKFVAKSAMGDIEGTVTLKGADEGALEGTIDVMDSIVQLEDALADGNSFTGKTEVKGPMGKMKIKVKGTVDGDNFSGSLDAGLMKFPFEGSRV